METQMRNWEEIAMLDDILVLVSKARYNSSLKFTEELFRYILLETEELCLQPVFGDLPFTLPLTHEGTGKIVKLFLTLMDAEIKALFNRIKEYIKTKENLKVIILWLGHKLICHSSYNLLYFFIITARIFALMFKAYAILDEPQKAYETPFLPDTFIETVVDVLEKYEVRFKSFGGFNALNTLVENFTKDPQLIHDLPQFKLSELLH